MTSTALLVMNVQQRIVERFADDESYLSRPGQPKARRYQPGDRR